MTITQQNHQNERLAAGLENASMTAEKLADFLRSFPSWEICDYFDSYELYDYDESNNAVNVNAERLHAHCVELVTDAEARQETMTFIRNYCEDDAEAQALADELALY